LSNRGKETTMGNRSLSASMRGRAGPSTSDADRYGNTIGWGSAVDVVRNVGIADMRSFARIPSAQFLCAVFLVSGRGHNNLEHSTHWRNFTGWGDITRLRRIQ
jgi:hypothetical protein